MPEKDFQPTQTITGVASSTRFAALYIHRYLLNKEVGFTLKLLQVFKKYNVSYEHMPSGIDDLTVIFDRTQFDEDTVHNMCHDIREVLKPDTLEWIDDYAIIMLSAKVCAIRLALLNKLFGHWFSTTSAST